MIFMAILHLWPPSQQHAYIIEPIPQSPHLKPEHVPLMSKLNWFLRSNWCWQQKILQQKDMLHFIFICYYSNHSFYKMSKYLLKSIQVFTLLLLEVIGLNDFHYNAVNQSFSHKTFLLLMLWNATKISLIIISKERCF